MNYKDSFIRALKANAPLFALVGERITAEFIPLATGAAGPSLSVHHISGDQDGAHDGDAGLTTKRFQVTVQGTDPEVVDSVMDLLVKLNCVEFTDPDGVELVLFHGDDRGSRDDSTEFLGPSVDIFVRYEN